MFVAGNLIFAAEKWLLLQLCRFSYKNIENLPCSEVSDGANRKAERGAQIDLCQYVTENSRSIGK